LNNNESVALKLLENWEDCNIQLTGQSVLYSARKNNMKNVVEKLLQIQYPWKYNNTNIIINTNESKEEPVKIINTNESKEEPVKIKKNECIICFNNNDKNVRFECEHILSICNTCVDKLNIPYKCPICRQHSSKIINCFVV
jgi:hypothetical protein